MQPSDPRVIAQKRVGETLNNKWTIDRLIDIGGMAAVYQATHRNGKQVAIEILHPFIATNADVRERFLREGYVANQVDHPGAVSILDDDVTADGAPFLVMELLEGESLDAWMARAGRDPAARRRPRGRRSGARRPLGVPRARRHPSRHQARQPVPHARPGS